MHPADSSIVGLPQFEILSIEGTETVEIRARYLGTVSCPDCQGEELRMKDSFVRILRHASLGIRPCYLHLQSHKYHCLGCGRYFNQRFPGIGKGRRSTEPFRKHFSKALIVADRFHVIRLVNEKFLACWAAFDPKGRANRGLLSLVRRHEENLKPEQRIRLFEYLRTHPAFGDLYVFKQKLCRLLRIKHRKARQCRRLIPLFLRAIERLRAWGMKPLVQLAETFDSWKEEIARMWRFTKNNGITEGFHNKMEMISRRAFGFRNFENYRLRVRVLCG